ncbi:MAG: hypothetical protein ACE364_09245 [Chlorobiota bacterium]
MEAAIQSNKSDGLELSTKVFLIYTFLLTMLFGFIDEGYYNFSWINNIGNWIALSVYFTFIFGTIYLIHRVLTKKIEELGSLFIAIPVGTVVGFAISVVLFTAGK